jgi:hypothetical protein
LSVLGHRVAALHIALIRAQIVARLFNHLCVAARVPSQLGVLLVVYDLREVI